MSCRPTRRRAVLGFFVLAACSGEAAKSSAQVPTPPVEPGGAVAAGELRACNLLTLEGATGVLGPDTERPGEDTEQASCLYSRPGVAMMTLQIWSAADYDRVMIMPPRIDQTIGDRGRSSVAENGATSVQFAKGPYSFTLSVTPLNRPPSRYLDAMLALARGIADRIPVP